jgi:hypothetical protein
VISISSAQLALRLVALRSQSLKGPQLALVQLCPNVMHAVRRPLCRLCRKVRLIKDRHASTSIRAGFPKVSPRNPTRPNS